MKSQLVSVVIPAYNVELYIKEAIESVQAQTHTNWEIILINDGSKDKTLEIATEMAKQDSRIKIYNQENKGMALATRAGLKLVTGEFTAFLDADDLITKDRFEKQIKYLNQHKHVDILGSNLYIKNGEQISEPNFFIYGKTFPEHMVRILPVICPCFPHPTAMFRSEILVNKWHYFRNIPSIFKGATPSQKKGNFADIYFSMLMVYRGYIVHTLPDRLYYYRMGKESLLHNNQKRDSEVYCYTFLTRVYSRLFFKRTKAIPDFIARVIINSVPESKIPIWHYREVIPGIASYISNYFSAFNEFSPAQKNEALDFIFFRTSSYLMSWILNNDNIIYNKEKTPWVPVDVRKSNGGMWLKVNISTMLDITKNSFKNVLTEEQVNKFLQSIKDIENRYINSYYVSSSKKIKLLREV